MSGAVVVLDVDGVLATDPALAGGAQALVELGYVSHEFDGLGPDGRPATGTVWLNLDHGSWLRELTDRGAELAWATSWGIRAVDWIAPRLGLPEMHVIDVPNHGPAFGWSPKMSPIKKWAAGRPVAWLDDQFGGKEYGWADDRRDEDGIPTLIVPVGSARGLLRQHVDEVLGWLDTDVAAHLDKEGR
ncbi:hypothetical protein [Amycolatopsis sp. CA-230715]|uniref:hypothetical protein n=1 Tax=Amycolatopsis sp. CA-230715 TaxID=2745196 RepID=UPI001C02E741|nr:hypothetical protein [Amycolatopsis sp. CA-230715]QWF85793.1 hypothetical protein HUW46_09273 [Amycolatopsis sp. CA-230715]